MKRSFALQAKALAFLMLASCAGHQPMNDTGESAAMENAMMGLNRHPTAIGAVADGYVVDWCSPRGGADGNKKFDLTPAGGEKVGGRLDASGCLKYTFRGGRVQPGQRISYYVEDQYQGGEVVPSGAVTGGPAPVPQPVPSAPTPAPLPQIDMPTVRAEADADARCTAKAVVGLYGQAEKFRFNYYIGFRRGLDFSNNMNMGDVRASADYQLASQQGSGDGAAQGTRAGSGQGSSDGAAGAARDVMARYVAIVDQGHAPDLSKTVPAISFQGLPSNLPAVASIDQRVASFDGQFRMRMMQMGIVNDGDTLGSDSWRDEWSLVNFYRWGQYDFNSVSSLYSQDWAFKNFHKRRFARCAQQADQYANITNPAVYANAADAKAVYEATFKDSYNDDFTKKWMKAVQKEDPAAQSVGQVDGAGIYQAFAKDSGYANGYSMAYSQASIGGYQGSFGPAYSSTFDAEVAKYEKNPVVQFEQAQAVDFQGRGKQFLVVGMPIGVNLQKVVNLGRQPGDFKVSVTGPSVAGPVYRMVHLDPSSTLKAGNLVGNLGTVAANASPDGTAVVSIHFGEQNIQDSFMASWNNLVVAFASQPAGAAQNTEASYIYNVCANEIDRTYHPLADPWGKRDPSLLTVRLANIVAGLPADKHASFHPVVAKLLAHVGKDPGWFSGKQSEYKDIEKLLNSIQ